MTFLQRIEKHRHLYAYLVIGAFFFINNTINATSVWMEHNRHGNPDIDIVEPFVWEYSSVIASLLLLPLLFSLFRRYPPRLSTVKRQLLIHISGSLIFSLAHTGLMVTIRKGVYALAGDHYDFGDWPVELFYEYRKDAWGYALLFVGYQLVRFTYSRLKGEAALIAENEEQANKETTPEALPEHFLVKKLDKEFLVKVADIEWLESSGNYVNLHSKGRIYPLRGTLGQLSDRLGKAGFSRVHRSHAVNHNAIESIGYLSSGDGEIKLKSGKTLALSRRYKEEFKRALS